MQHKLNILVTVVLLRSRLVKTSLQDQQMAESFISPHRILRLAWFGNACLVTLQSQPKTSCHMQLRSWVNSSQPGKLTSTCLYYLSQYHGLMALNSVQRLFDYPHGVVIRPNNAVASDGVGIRWPSVKPETEQEKPFSWFQQWVTVFQHLHSPEKAFVPYITQLTKQGILKVEDVSSFFFRVCADSSVNSCLKCVATREFEYAFQALNC